MNANPVPQPKNHRRNQHGWKIALGIIISLVFVVMALYKVDYAKLWQILTQINPLWLLAASGLILLSYFFRSLLWQQLLLPHRQPRIWNLFRIITIGYFANNLLPLKIGEFVRAWLLGRQEKLSTSLAIATVVIERGTDLLALLFYLCLLMFFIPLEPWLKLSGLIMMGAGIVFVLALILNYRFGGHLLEVLEKPLQKLPRGVGTWLHIQLGKFLEGLKLIQSPGQVLKILVLALLTWFSWISVIFVCFQALGMKLPFFAAIFLMVVLNLGLMLPSSPGGLGVFEFMFILALAPYGVGKELALGVGFTFHMLQYFLTFLLGWIFTLQLNVSMLKVYPRAEEREMGNS